jgi:glucosamine--fructose-6-phosphate aminotransferase (isomerizing)
MLKEIFEQPAVVHRCLLTYLDQNWHPSQSEASSIAARSRTSPFRFPFSIDGYTHVHQIQILACGTSLHAGLIGQFWLEQIAGISTQVRSASEFQVAPLPWMDQTLTIAITQSGETADTLAALDLAKQQRLQPACLGITNQPQAAIAQRVNHLLPTLAGAEMGVAATKTFLSQLMVFCLLALDLAYARGVLSQARLLHLIEAFQKLPDQIEALLNQQNDRIARLATQFTETQSMIVLGSGLHYPIALEGALKLKETTYIHAEGYAAGEFLHGPIALLDQTIPVLALMPADATYRKLLTSIRKAKSHQVSVTGIMTTDDSEAARLLHHQITIPQTDPLLTPLLAVIPLQLLAYHIAIQRGLNVDKPRYLEKTLVGE